MSKGRTAPRWQPMQRAVRAPLHPTIIEQAKTDPAIAEHLERPSEMWRNDRYTVTVYRREHSEQKPELTGTVECLSIKRNGGGAVRDWRHMQQIKNELAGEDVEGFQIFPAKSRTVDTANQMWIFCLPPGMVLPAGFPDRAVEGPEEAEKVGADQREFEEGLAI